MGRAEKIKKAVEKDIVQRFEKDKIRRGQLLDELNHLNGVVMLSKHLAMERGYDSDLAAVAAALHDVGRSLLDVPGKPHAREGARKAKAMMKAQGGFSQREMETVIGAIQTHNRKGKTGHGPYNELLKDADLLARYFEDPDQVFGPNKTRRLFRLKREIYGSYQEVHKPVSLLGQVQHHLIRRNLKDQ